MNLADIRKKAGLAADTSESPGQGAPEELAVDFRAETVEESLAAPLSPDFVGIALEPDEETVFSASLAADEPGDESLMQLGQQAAAAVEEFTLPEDAPLDLPGEEFSFPLEEPLEPLCPVEPALREAVAAPPSAPYTAYNPLAVLLAGRVSMDEESEGAASESEVESSADNLLEYLCFRVSHELYAVNIMEIKEIIKPREWTEVPRAPHFICGVISLRGVIIPVFDMRRRLGLPQIPASGKERIVVVKDGESYCGILVDEVVQVVRIPVTSIEPAPTVLEGIDRDFVIGIGRHEGTMLILLSLENILNLALV